MKSVCMEGQGRVKIVEAPEPTPGPGEVVVEMAASALCGSELHAYRGGGKAAGNNGHEGAGVVATVGPGVTGLSVGRRVGLSAVVGCGACDYCRAGQYTWCGKARGYGNMHAQRAVIPAHGCHPLPDDVPWDIAVLLSGDGLGVPYHTATKVQDPAARTVAVFGVGPIGLGNALMQCWLGREVIAIDVAPARLGLARAVGAAHTVDAARENVVERVRELSGGRGADVCIEAAGRPETLRQCFEAVRKGGQILINGEQPKLELSPSEDFVRRDITATGAWFYHFAEFPRMLELYRQGLPVGRLVTHRYPLEQADEAFREFAAGRTGKVLLAMQPT